MKNNRIFQCGILAALICMITLSGVLLYQNWKLDNLQQSMLQELDSGEGCYDPQSIVLRDTSKAEAEKLAEALGAQLRITQDGHFAALYLPEEMTIRDVVAEDENREILSQMSIDYQVQVSDLSEENEETGLRLPARPDYTVSDEGYGQQHYLDYLNMGNVWTSYNGKGVTVAVIDTGIDTDHPEFAGRISEYSYNATEDKIVKDYQIDWSLIEDEVGHGTAVTGVLAAAMNNEGVVGIAPNVEIIVIKAECDENGNFKRSSDLVFALYYAIERDVQVVNMSFGVGQNVFAEAIQLAYDSDVICVASAGNGSTATLTYPAADPLVIGVGALESGSWNLADYSNYGESVDIVAPGTTYTAALGGGYETKHGTSMSAPQVAGAIALFMQNNRYATFDKVTEVLYASSYDLGDLGRDWYYGFGGLDLHAFLLEERGTVTFEMLTDELENEDGLFIRNHTIQELPEPERLYAVFDGWYYDDMFTEEYNYYSDVFTSDLTLYAKWVNEDDGIPYTYVVLDDGTVEIRSYTGHRRFITVPEKIDGRVVSSIGDCAFSGQTRLREVTLPKGLTNIGVSAFAGCSNLVTMHIPANVTQLGDYAFANNVRLSTLSFAGNKLTTIGDFAFSGCSRLERMELPSSVNSVYGSAFYGTTSMQHITVRSGNTVFASRDGVLFTADGSKIVAYPAGRDGEYSLPETCTEIGDYAFACSGLGTIDLKSVSTVGMSAFERVALETLTIPDGVTSIGSGAFAFNVKLTQVQLGNGLTQISGGMFNGCSALQDIHIPAGIQSINGAAFGVSGLKTVTFASDSKLETIGDSAFDGCSIETISIPDSVTTIGDSAFYDNPLTSVILSEESQLNTIGMEAFCCCWLLTGIDLPGELEIIEELAFANTGLTAVTVPKSVTMLGDGVFAYCNDLAAVTVEADNSTYHDIDGVVYSSDNILIHTYPAGKTDASYTLETDTTSIGSYAFAGTSHLTTVYLSDVLVDINKYGFDGSGIDYITIPDSMIRLGRYSFTNCLDLTKVSFNSTSNLARIGYSAFVNCGLTRFTVPANVSTMGQEVFADCDALTSVTFAANSKLESLSAYVFKGCENIRSITFLPGSALTSIQAHGLEGMAKLTSIDFGDAAVTNIDNFAFRFCTSLSTLDLPETVTNVGRYAFYGCESLSELTLPENVEHIGSYAFLGTTDLQLYLSADYMPEYLDEDWDRGIAGYYVGVTDVNTSGDYRYAMLTSGGIAILEYLGSAESVDLTAVDLGRPITAIGGKAFLDSTITSVTLPDSLTEIQAEAFAYTNLTSVTIPASVTFIGREAFAGTDIATLNFTSESKVKTIEQKAFAETEKLVDVTIPASVTKLGTGVFQDSGLINVTFTDGIQLAEIPQRAFMGTKLESVNLPDSVTLVNHNAFNGVSTLRSVTFGNNDGIRLMSNAFYRTGLTTLDIPANVTYIGEFCFVGLENLDDFTVDADNPNYTEEDGLLLSKNGRKLIAVPAGRTGSLTVPLSVEEIGFGAFERSSLREVNFDPDANILTLGCRAFFEAENLTKITIPASVVSVDYYAFAYCENLQTVEFAAGNQLRGIYEGAFCGDIALKNITVPDAIVEISDFAFYGCSKLDQLPVKDASLLKGIYDYAFAYTGISGDFTTPENLIDIGNYAFAGIKAEKITVPDTKQKELIIGLGAFEGCNELTEITLPFIGARFEDESVTWFSYIFGAGDYSNKDTIGDVIDVYVPDSLKIVTITEGISFVGYGGFSNCVGLEVIHIPRSVDTLYPDAFRNTTAVHEFANEISIYCPDRTKALVKGYFGRGVSGNLYLTEGIKTIEHHAFEYCDRLARVVIPDGVTYIGSSAFYGCSDLREVVIPDSVKTIGGLAFYSCRSLRHINLPEKLTKIAEYTFEYCSSLTDIVIPDNVTCIEKHAFYCCTGLDQIVIPKNVSQIDSEAFYGCKSLFNVRNESTLDLQIGSSDCGCAAYYAKKLTDRNGNVSYLDETAGFEYLDTPEGFRFLLEDNEYKLVSYLGMEETITLPKDINGNPYTMYYFTGATNVILPEGIAQIDDYAFYDCGSLKSVVMPKSVKKIGNYAFRNTGLTEIVIPEGVESIGIEAFCGSSLSAVQLPNTLKDIGSSAFEATDLISVMIPSGVARVGSEAFGSCNALRNVTLSKSMTSIPAGLFQWCDQLVHIEIPARVKDIHPEAFVGCYNLRSVVLPEGLKTIGTEAFAECMALRSVEIPDTVVTIGSSAFRGCNSLRKLYIPEKVSKIGGAAFDRDLLVEIAPSNSMFCMIDGILYDKQVTTIVQVTASIPNNVVIPDSVTTIPSFAFAECMELESVCLPDGIKKIGESAFQNCVQLTEIEIPARVTSISVRTFEGCRNLREVMIPDGVTNIGSSAFAGCSALQKVNLPSKLTYISQGLFYDCRSLRYVEIPNGVTKICGSAFSMCSALTEIHIPSSVTQIEYGAFSHCDKLFAVHNDSDLVLSFGSYDSGNLAYYAKMIVDKNGAVSYRDRSSGFELIDTADGFRFMKEYGTYTLLGFMGDEAMVMLPDSFEGQSYAVYQFFGGEYIILPDTMTVVPDSAFGGNGTVKQVTLPDDTARIESSAFINCYNLQNITIPGKVSEIGEGAFYNCCSLEKITIPNSVTSVGDRCFESCENLRQLVLPDNLEYVGWRLVRDTYIYNEPGNWCSGGLAVSDYLLEVKDDAVYLDYSADLRTVAEKVYSETKQLKTAIYCGDMDGTTNVETMVVLEYDSMPEPLITLKNVVLTERIRSSDLYNNPSFFRYMDDITIFVEAEEKDLRWDANFPGWNNGNKVIYGDNWIWVNFYDTDGTLLLSEPKRTSEGIRRPFVDKQDECCTYELIGWDLDGDGDPDTVPATSATDINAVAVYDTPDHDFSGWTMVKEPTTTSEGLESRYCYHCDFEETRTVARLKITFTDVVSGTFYYEPVMWAVENGITNGISATTFGPNDQCMRAHVVTFLWRAAGSPEPNQTDNPFVDVKPSDFYYEPVLWALENGITSGMDATHFGPTSYCNRAQVVTFLYRTMESPEIAATTNPFTDVQASSFYEKPVLWAVENGITNGLSATAFGPNTICNRAQIVTFLYRAFVE